MTGRAQVYCSQVRARPKAAACAPISRASINHSHPFSSSLPDQWRRWPPLMATICFCGRPTGIPHRAAPRQSHRADAACPSRGIICAGSSHRSVQAPALHPASSLHVLLHHGDGERSPTDIKRRGRGSRRDPSPLYPRSAPLGPRPAPVSSVPRVPSRRFANRVRDD